MTKSKIDMLNESIRRRRYKEALRHILEIDDLNVVDSHGYLPLTRAVSMKSTNRMNVSKIIKVLVWRGANIDATDPVGETALFCAVKNNRFENMITLIRLGSSMDKQNYEGQTPMMIAASMGKLKTVKALVANGANAEVADTTGKIAWNYASNAVYCQYFLFKHSLSYLLEKRANSDLIRELGLVVNKATSS